VRIGILGYGSVGRAVGQLSSVHSVAVYDPCIAEYHDAAQKDAALGAEVVFCCVPTQARADGSLDTSIVEALVDDFAVRKSAGLFVIKSTVTPGTTERLAAGYGIRRMLSCPEFLSERTADADFGNPIDVVIGGDPTDAALLRKCLDQFYRFGENSTRYTLCSATEAELVKSARNAFYASKISFMNELAALCTRLGIDYATFRQHLTQQGEHPWLGGQHTRVPGPDGRLGFGGKCLTKDARDLFELSVSLGVPMRMIEASLEVNAMHRNVNPEPSGSP
jgi:UDPglucose 6-dehydrogenase